MPNSTDFTCGMHEVVYFYRFVGSGVDTCFLRFNYIYFACSFVKHDSLIKFLYPWSLWSGISLAPVPVAGRLIATMPVMMAAMGMKQNARGTPG